MLLRSTALCAVLLLIAGVRAQDEDEEDEMTHRASLTWGRVFLEGGVQHRQFFKVPFALKNRRHCTASCSPADAPVP